MSHKALLEIGTEEIPAKLIRAIHNNLQNTAQDILVENSIFYGDIKILGAPRRLTVIITGLPEYQQDLVEEIKGPPCNIAFDEEGEPTRAATGFAGSQNLTVADLEVKNTDKGDYLYAIIERGGKAVVDLLPTIFKEIITELDFSITMRWGDSDFEFIRPIHWLLGLYDKQVIEFEIENIAAGRTSRGHRFLANREVDIDSVDSYCQQLEQVYVIVDPEKRKKLIRQQIKDIETDIEGKVVIDEDLMSEIIHLVEFPTAFCGEYDPEYLRMPEPVLVTPIKEHQRYFVIRDEDNNLMSLFIGVRDGSDQHLEVVKEGNEKVLKARLDDAEFYFEKDIEMAMDDRVEELKNLVFIEELGSMYQKMKRIKKLASSLGQESGLRQEKIERIERAARLAKADLVSQMVREFSELQGIIGREYALREGEEEEIARAISEHYLPRFAGDLLPETTTGIMVSIADRLDTLVGSFGVGLIPTGSEDPFGLRRSALGLIRILWKKDIDRSLSGLLESTLAAFGEYDIQFERPGDEVKRDVHQFLLERVSYLLSEQGVDYDIVEALLADSDDRIPRIFARANKYGAIRSEQEFAELVIAYSRIENIVGDGEQGEIKPELLTDDSEKKLYRQYLQVEEKLQEKEIKESFIDIYRQLTVLISPVHDFFESVMVMSEDKNIRQNRINLLLAIKNLMSKMGDLSRIVVE